MDLYWVQMSKDSLVTIHDVCQAPNFSDQSKITDRVSDSTFENFSYGHVYKEVFRAGGAGSNPSDCDSYKVKNLG